MTNCPRFEAADHGIAETRVRYGYCRIEVLLRREGWQVINVRVLPFDALLPELGLAKIAA